VNRQTFPAILMFAVLLSGCDGKSTTTPETKTPAAPLSAPATEVALRVVKFSQLEEAIRQQAGKIVVLDLWATWCVPCKQEFPGLVELHHRHGKDGVVCMSLTLDEPESKAAALKFLTEKGATIPNFLIEDEESKWQDKWQIGAIPVVFVYGRDGQVAKRFDYSNPDQQFTYGDVEKFVAELLSR
jgi:thiol-disulfide isomerase/thioredoxin